MKFVPTQRNFQNRPAKTFKIEPLTVTKNVYWKFSIEKDLANIRAKFPMVSKKNVFIYQDIARSHVSVNGLEGAQKLQTVG